ncbi:hypothetical protein [Candidatus Pantoea bituminis]|nr:hypothetical protein [Pantoea bituminis]
MIAGIHDPSDYEAGFIAEHRINTCSPDEIKKGADKISEWIKR